MSLYTRALNLVHRLTGREAAALRYQRNAHAEEAGRERQRRMAAERRYRAAVSLGAKAARALRASKVERDAAKALLRALCDAVQTGDTTDALAEALTFLGPRATEQEGLRGGLAWMPGEAQEDP